MSHPSSTTKTSAVFSGEPGDEQKFMALVNSKHAKFPKLNTFYRNPNISDSPVFLLEITFSIADAGNWNGYWRMIIKYLHPDGVGTHVLFDFLQNPTPVGLIERFWVYFQEVE